MAKKGELWLYFVYQRNIRKNMPYLIKPSWLVVNLMS